MQKLSWQLRLLKQSEKGGVLILVAVSMFVLIGMTALAIDVGQLYVTRRQMVNAADSAALAGAFEMQSENNPSSNNSRTRQAAREYALLNDADESFHLTNDVKIYGSDGALKIAVRTFNQVDYTFARVLGLGPSTDVYAMATAQVGPGNPLTPFVDIAWPFDCPCWDDEDYNCQCPIECECECACPVDCNCEPCEECQEDAGGCEECAPCDCPVDCSCPPEDCQCEADCPCYPECTCNYFSFKNPSNPDDDDNGDYYIKNGAGEPVGKYDRFRLHDERWQDWDGYTSGVFPFVRLPGLSGGADLRQAIAGGYDGSLSAVSPGTHVPSEPGQVQGGLSHGLQYRIDIAGEDHCKHPDELNGNYYDCILVIIVPLVISVDESNENPKPFKIVGFASFLLDLEEHGKEKHVYAYFLEYLTFEELKTKVNLPDNLESFTVRLIKNDPNIF